MDNHSLIPLYIQIAQRLRDRIKDGTYQAGDRLPSEKELVAQFGISRITATAALDELVKEHLAYQERGRGTFVAKAFISDLSFFSSFSEDMRDRGLSPSSKLVSLHRAHPDKATTTKLHMPVDEEYFCLARIRLANNEPVVLQYAYLPVHLYPKLDQVDFNVRYLFEVIRNDYRFNPLWAEAIVEAAAASTEEAGHLGIKSKTPVLIVWHLTLDDRFTPLEYVRSVYRADRFSFSTGRNQIRTFGA